MEFCTRNLFLLYRLWINILFAGDEKITRYCTEKKTGNAKQRWLVPSPQQCPCPHGLECVGVSGKKHHDGYPPSSLFTWFAPCDFCCVSYETPEVRETFCWCQVSEIENAGGLEQHQHSKSSRKVFSSGKTLVQAYQVKRRILWRRLELYYYET